MVAHLILPNDWPVLRKVLDMKLHFMQIISNLISFFSVKSIFLQGRLVRGLQKVAEIFHVDQQHKLMLLPLKQIFSRCDVNRALQTNIGGYPEKPNKPIR